MLLSCPNLAEQWLRVYVRIGPRADIHRTRRQIEKSLEAKRPQCSNTGAAEPPLRRWLMAHV
jgi:hypothetical protein